MSGYYAFQQLHNAVVLQSPIADIVLQLTGFGTLVYRIRISAASDPTRPLDVQINTTDLAGNVYQITKTGGIFGAGQAVLYVSPVFSSIRVRYNPVVGGVTWTVTDEIEVAG